MPKISIQKIIILRPRRFSKMGSEDNYFLYREIKADKRQFALLQNDLFLQVFSECFQQPVILLWFHDTEADKVVVQEREG